MKLNVFRYLLSLLIFIYCTLSYSHAQAQLTEEELEWIRNNPTVTVTSQSDWAPFDFTVTGMPYGFSVEYVNLVASKVGLKTEFISGYTWTELLDKSYNDEIDIIHSLVRTEERAEHLIFTETYFEMPVVYFGRDESNLNSSETDISNLRIGLVEDTAQSRYIRERFPDYNFVSTESSYTSVMALARGEFDVFLGRAPVVNYILQQNNVKGISILDKQYFPELLIMNQIRMGTHKTNDMLRNILDKGMLAVSDEEYRALTRKWNTDYLAAAGHELTDEELNWLHENPVVRVAASPISRPIEFISEDGQITGMTGDYLNILSRMLNVEFEWVGNETWGQGYDMAVAGDADMMSFMIENVERRQYFDFTDGYLTGFYAIFAKDGEEMIGAMEGLIGKKVAQIQNSAISNYILRDYPGIEIIDVATTVEALDLVENGVADAHVGVLPIASYYITTEGFDNIRVVGQTQYDITFSMGVIKDKPLLYSALYKAMSAISTADEIEISRKWLSTTVNEGVDYTFVWQIVGAGMFVLVIVLIWAISLRREINRREIIERELIFARETAWEMQAKAEEANAAKSQFLANMSHEIRTPLNAIIGFSEAISSGIYGEVAVPKHKEYLKDIKFSGEHLATIINDVLDLSKIEAGKWKLEKEKFDLIDSAKSTVNIIKPMAEEKGVELSLISEDECIIDAEKHAMKRVMINLLSNAVKFTDSGGRVKLKITSSNGNVILIEVVDTGIGIPEDKLERVLRPFEQDKDVRISNEGGTGLGLPIVQQLTELHGGTFELSSEVGVGTKATITIPRNIM
ncbi:transporter substrate-binding domain-containing protein [Pseudemcibacter aquimaris]|uniref:transporter substrate-binding domain-containing protein n=1 Tax=Pseudemcibacter aquimaris TaxID=2857064 RepID=UPI0020123194|nr:transporter substrate-binding domain-containing protein [Pseudemcibacter aquimaris]MCC3862557.1 transporter substrate-binding domain-containing protein [Pseudemcibacter aquimaris]WDU57924.1 transporter substrate-binding domain-containing protein [Pseudemcibacter aquimaris]